MVNIGNLRYKIIFTQSHRDHTQSIGELFYSANRNSTLEGIYHPIFSVGWTEEMFGFEASYKKNHIRGFVIGKNGG
jgi:hypothetical protein